VSANTSSDERVVVRAAVQILIVCTCTRLDSLLETQILRQTMAANYRFPRHCHSLHLFFKYGGETESSKARSWMMNARRKAGTQQHFKRPKRQCQQPNRRLTVSMMGNLAFALRNINF